MASALVNNAGVSPTDGFLDFSPGGGAAGSSLSWLSPSRVSSSAGGGRERDSIKGGSKGNSNGNGSSKQQRQVSPGSPPGGKKKPSGDASLSIASSSSAAAAAAASALADDVVVGAGETMDDFEFRLGDPVDGMLSADELFADGKLVPLQASATSCHYLAASRVDNNPDNVETAGLAAAKKVLFEAGAVGTGAAAGGEQSVLISPRAPKCSSRWKELLRFKKAAQNAKLEQVQKAAAAAAAAAPTASVQGAGDGGGGQQQRCHGGGGGNNSNGGGGSSSNNLRSLRHFLHRSNNANKSLFSSSTTTPGDGGCSLTLPLLRGDVDSSSSSSDSISIPARLSLSSSSSSGADHDDLPRLSLDSDRPGCRANQPPRLWLSRPQGGSDPALFPSRIGRSPGRRGTEAAATVSPPARCASVDSPRMNSSGKVVFQNLGRSSSSPSSIGGGGVGGGSRSKGGGRAGVERSYSTNVRITPVLNVPVCSLKSGSVFGLGLFSPQKKTSDRDHHHHHQHLNHVHHGGGGSRRGGGGGGSSSNGGGGNRGGERG